MIGRIGLVAAGLFLLSQLLFSGTAQAEPRIALVIGNSHYGSDIGSLPNPVNDAGLMAQALQQTVGRPGDTVARYGGEEFALIAADTDADSGNGIAHKMCEAIYALAIPHGMSEFGVVTISVGVASCVPPPEGDFHTLLQTADAALYRAKVLGRNQTLVADIPA